MNNSAINIIVVDDNVIFLEGIIFYLKDIMNYNIINKAHDGYEFICLENLYLADIILLDIEMPILRGTEAAKKALIKNDKLKIIAVTNYSDKAYLSELIKCGFKGCVFKSDTYDDINIAIQKVMKGELFFPETIKL